MAAHGTKAAYDRDKCRCGDCRAANASYMRQYRIQQYTRQRSKQ